MKLGVMSDIHGNRIALDAVLADAADVGVDRWWVLGDLVAIGPEPAATLEVLADLPEAAITSGNTERYVLTGDRPPPHAGHGADAATIALALAMESSFSWTRGALAATGWLDWLAALPPDTRLTLPDGTRVLGVHATPGRDDGPGITPHRDADELAAALTTAAAADIVIGGHTHQPTDRTVAGIRALNGGSVSNPIVDDLRAQYLVIHADEHTHRVEHRRVAYDRDAFLARLASSGHPQGEYIASFQRGEQVRHRAAI